MSKPELYHYRLTENQGTRAKNPDGKGHIVSYPAMYSMSAEIQTVDEKGETKIELHSKGIVRDKFGKDVPVLDKIWFKHGQLCLYMPQDKKLIQILERAQKNASNKHRFDTTPAVFEKVDAFKDKMKKVSKTENLVAAWNTINNASADDLLEYALSVKLNTYGVEELMKVKGKKEKIKESNEFKMMEADIKNAADLDAAKFIKAFENPFRPILTVIRKGIDLKVITMDKQIRTYFWVVGKTRKPIVQLEEGISATEEWFASYLNENQSTLTELKKNIELSEAA